MQGAGAALPAKPIRPLAPPKPQAPPRPQAPAAVSVAQPRRPAPAAARRSAVPPAAPDADIELQWSALSARVATSAHAREGRLARMEAVAPRLARTLVALDIARPHDQLLGLRDMWQEQLADAAAAAPEGPKVTVLAPTTEYLEGTRGFARDVFSGM